jgi:hypothetical protein
VLAQALYGLIAATFLAAGTSVVLLKTGLLPANVHAGIEDFGHGDGNTLHIIQELSSLLVLVGLLTFWFMRHYEQSQFFHWSMTAFWALIAFVHWVDVRGPSDEVAGPLITTIPFFLFVAIGLLRLATEGGRAAREPEVAAVASRPGA